VINWREIILGYPYYKHKHLIKKTKKWNSYRVLDYNNQKLKNHSGNNITAKKDYLKRTESFKNRVFSFLTTKVTTGGTTGIPFVFDRDILCSRQKERAYIFDIWKDVGYKPFDLRVIYRGNVSNKGKLISYNLFENAYIIDPRNLNEKSKSVLLEQLKKLPPFFLHVYPSSLFAFVQAIGNENFKNLKIKGVLAGSEAFPKGQMESFSKNFKIPIAHWYGHSEYAVLAKYCFRNDAFCFYPTYGAVEFLQTKDPDIYSIIATSFNKIGTQFIRYDTQDFCTKSGMENCSDNNFITAKTIIGRGQDFFYDKEGNTNAFGPYLFGMHGVFWNCFDKIQFVQEKKGSMSVLIQNEKNEKLRYILKERFLDKVELEFFIVDTIPLTTSGKHRYFIQEV